MKEMISADEQSGSIAFRPHARLIRLLGDELISDEIMAAVELVKNAYDADASHVQIMLNHITDPSIGQICIRDDGDGMELFTLLHVWMEPATTHKRKRHRNKQRTARGRILLGEKGVGRFAADKLGAELELVTRDRSADRELVLQVSWHRFDDDDKYLEDVRSSWFAREPVEFPGEQHGTLLRIRSLRVAWTQEMVNRLYNGLSRLVSPFAGKTDFVIEITCPDFPAVQGKVINRLLETAPYRLSGAIDREGYFISNDQQEQPVDLRTLCHDQFMTASGERREPLCGPFRISLNVWDLDLLPGKGAGIDRTLREAIKSFCGVSVYRDGFRVWPYGEKDDDWLELNQRRVNNPTLRISNNQIIGFIEITHEDNPDLKDRTSREGLIDTAAFFDLRALVLAALSLLEASRFNQRHQVTISRTIVEEEKDDLLGYLSEVSSQNFDSAQQQSLRSAAREIEKLYRQKLEQERERYDRISALAGVGAAAELLTDGLMQEVNKTVMLMRILQGEAQVDASPRIRQTVERLARQMDLIHEQLDLMEPLYHPRSQFNDPVDIRGAVYDVLSAMSHKLKEAKVQVSLECDTNLMVRISRGYLMQAMMIVIANALEAMSEEAIPDPRIEIQIVSGKEFAGVLIGNNGPAIPDQYRKLIFEPSFSMRKAGRGLGLHVARDLLAICHCALELAEEAPLSLSGPCFRIRFDRRKVVEL
jgi:signal transduction histidine kinase